MSIEPEIEALFKAIAEDLARQNGTLEITADQLKKFGTDREQMEILWTLAEEAVRDPSGTQNKYREVTRSEAREVHAEEGAAKALKQFEQRLDSKVFSLRRGGPKVTKGDEGEVVAAHAQIPAIKINPATRRERLCAGLVDTLYIASLAAASTVSVLWFTEPSLKAKLFSPSELPLPEVIALGAIFFAVAAIFSFFYPWVAGSRTTGQKLMGLEVYEQSGREATQQELFLRSAMLPVSALLTLIFPPLWRDLGFHNRLSKTVVHSRSEQNK